MGIQTPPPPPPPPQKPSRVIRESPPKATPPPARPAPRPRPGPYRMSCRSDFSIRGALRHVVTKQDVPSRPGLDRATLKGRRKPVGGGIESLDSSRQGGPPLQRCDPSPARRLR